jgi:osmotically-inducible protein OsmY
VKTDSQLQSEVLQELKWDPSVTHEHIGVAVDEAIVTLSGTVPTYIEKRAAEKAAQRVAGVKAVVEKIEVKLPGIHERDDKALAKAILEQFKWNAQVPDQLIKASVEDGSVELSGEVEWDYQRNAAEKCVRGLIGVKNVTNSIRIKAKRIQPEIVKQKIEEALKREVERETRKISVEVSGSKVILSGDVHSFTELWRARGAAMSAPGVTSVENNLHITN